MTPQERIEREYRLKKDALAYATFLRKDERSLHDPVFMGLAGFLERIASGEEDQAQQGADQMTEQKKKNPAAPPTFWIVCNEQIGAPKKKHFAEHEAMQEAEELATRHKCRSTVFKSVCEFAPYEVKRTDHAHE